MDDLFHKPTGPAPPPPAAAARTQREITLVEQIAELRRELKMRSWVYPSQVRRGKLTQAASDLYTDRLCAALKSLEDLAAGHCKHCGAISE